MKNNIIHSSIITASKKKGVKHNYQQNRKKRKYVVQKEVNANPDILMSKRDQESVCAVRKSAGLNCRNCKYYQHKYCLYDQGLTID